MNENDGWGAFYTDGEVEGEITGNPAGLWWFDYDNSQKSVAKRSFDKKIGAREALTSKKAEQIDFDYDTKTFTVISE